MNSKQGKLEGGLYPEVYPEEELITGCTVHGLQGDGPITRGAYTSGSLRHKKKSDPQLFDF